MRDFGFPRCTLFVVACVSSFACDEAQAPSPDTCSQPWTADGSNPHIEFGAFGGFIWNDPSVLKEGDLYRMWLSNGTGSGDVAIYEARSGDGITWTLQSSIDSPQLAPSLPWDQAGTETPSVVRVGGTYHLYYTAVPDETFVTLQIGHATSPDGINWVKDPEPAIARPTEPNEWGWLGVAEPGVTYANGTFYLYYAMVRCRQFVGGTCGGSEPRIERGIALATSTDGINFTPDPGNPILVQSARYPASELYEGYSTPSALLSGGTFYLAYDVVQSISGQFRQVAITLATSADGRTFSEVAPDVLVREGWTAREIRAPTLVEEGGRFVMWFAGNSSDDPSAPGFELGIGRATSPPGCP